MTFIVAIIRLIALSFTVCFMSGVVLILAVLVSITRAKSLKHNGSWWALYVLGLHAIFAPTYTRLRRAGEVGVKLSKVLGLVYQILTLPTGAEIPLNAKIGQGLLLGHTSGVVLNYRAEVGERCVITPGVVLGGDGRGGAPKVGSNVFIGANAVIAGSVSIGDNTTIGACSVVTRDVPPNSLVVGNPASVVKMGYQRGYHNRGKDVK